MQSFNAYGPAYAPNIAGRTQAWGKELAASPCGIVQAQEVWSDAHYDEATRFLAKSLPWMSAVHFDHDQRPYVGKAGLALFTDHVILETRFEQFTTNQDGVLDDIRTSLGVIKGMGTSHLRLRNDDRDVHLIDLHTHPSSQVIRLAQMTQLLSQFDRLLPLEHPLIVSGDFNFVPQSLEYRLLRDLMLLKDAYTAANGPYTGDECTYCEANPHHWGGGDRVIDYIWFRNSSNFTLTSKQSWINLRGLAGLVPSDHYGLRTLFDLKVDNPTLVDDQTFKQRRFRALTTTQSAIQTLIPRQSDDSGVQLAVMTLRYYEQRLLKADPKDPFIAQFMIP